MFVASSSMLSNRQSRSSMRPEHPTKWVASAEAETIRPLPAGTSTQYLVQTTSWQRSAISAIPPESWSVTSQSSIFELA